MTHKNVRQIFFEEVQFRYDGDFYRWFKNNDVDNDFFDNFQNDPIFQLELVRFYKAFCKVEELVTPLRKRMHEQTNHTVALPIVDSDDEK